MNDRAPSRRSLSALWHDADGVSAIEFSLILPVMLAMLFGTIELGHAYENWRKVNNLARAVADLTSQGDTSTPIRSSKMSDILASSGMVLRPFDSAGAKIVVSALGVDLIPGTRPRVCSSFAGSGATARSLGVASDLTIPPGFQLPGMRYLLVETKMDYTPIFASAMIQSVAGFNNLRKFSVVVPWPVRGGQKVGVNTYNEVILPSGIACPLL